MFKNQGIERKFISIVRGKRFDLIAPFLGTWQDDEEMIDKVLLWGHFFLPHYFRDQSPAFHRDIIRDFFSKENEYKAAPRGFSKTTILQTCCDFSCVNKLDTFIVIVEKTFTEAAEVIKGVHDEFIDNENIILCYGNLLSKAAEEILETARIKQSEAKGDVFINGVRIRGKGFNSSIRGLKTRQWRPSRIVLDDVEEDEHINNPEQRRKYSNNYRKGIMPAVDVDGSIKVFGTILHQDSLLKNLIEMHGGKIYRAHGGTDPATAPADSFLWPERWSRERLIKKREDMMSEGQSSNAYAQEYLNDPISEEERAFKFQWLWEMIKRPDGKGEYRVPAKRITMDQFEKLRSKTVLNGYAMLDNADSTKESADFTGAVVWFVDPAGNRYRVDVRREKRNIKGVIDLIFEIWDTWAAKGLIKIGLEKKAFEDQVLPLFEEEKRRRQCYPILEELKPNGRAKENRIKGGLQGHYEMGKIVSVGRIDDKGFFIPVGNIVDENGTRATDCLLEELYNFPSSKHDDLSDAEAYGPDIVVIPLADEEKASPGRSPVDDPWEEEERQSIGLSNSHIGGHDDSDPFA